LEFHGFIAPIKGSVGGAAERGGELIKDLYFYILHVIIFSKGEITCRIF
jgi:hypothetical protein